LRKEDARDVLDQVVLRLLRKLGPAGDLSAGPNGLVISDTPGGLLNEIYPKLRPDVAPW
jgi:hypothetical protein